MMNTTHQSTLCRVPGRPLSVLTRSPKFACPQKAFLDTNRAYWMDISRTCHDEYPVCIALTSGIV